MRVVEDAILRLEPLTAAHTEEMFDVLCDPAIYQLEGEPPASVEWLQQRFLLLEKRQSPDGGDQWLNWAIRLQTGELIGYVQATVVSHNRAGIAYVLSSRYWGRGLATAAVRLMIDELAAVYRVQSLTATLKRDNLRSRRLLQKLGFVPAPAELHSEYGAAPDELVMRRECCRPRIADELIG